jgi:hypothetical protein
MTPRILTVTLSAFALGLGLTACGSDDTSSSSSTAPAASASTGTATTDAASGTSVGASGANTTAVAKAADAFLATLTSSQRSTVQLEFSDQGKKTSWSNLPAALSPRKGIALGDMSAAQQKAALALMKVALSAQGYEELAEVREADDYLAAKASAGGGPGAGDYGSGNYYFVLYGKPSASQPWLLQYTGHHLTYNIAYKGSAVTFGPAFEGVEPITFAKGGKTIAPLTDEAGGFAAIIKALNSSQQKQAALSGTFDDLLLGAKNDGPFPATPEGVKVSDLSQAGQDAVTKTIRAYVGDLGSAAADNLVKSYVAAYDKTSFAYAGGSHTVTQGFYARIDGPKVWIEISTQHGIVLSGTHYHSIYREQGSDYGGP